MTRGSCTQDQLFISLYYSDFLGAIPQGTPISSSPSSVLLRTAALESIITKEMSGIILQGLFPWNLAGESGLLECLQEDLARADPRKEAIFRALIWSSDVLNRREREASAITSVVDKVASVCSPLLELNNLDRSFREDLQTLLLEVVKFWARAQRHQTRIVAVCKAEAGVAGWETRDRYGKVPEDANHLDLGYPAAILFPQLYKQLPTGEMDVLYNGFTVWSEQEMYVEGKREFHTQRRRASDYNSGRTDTGNRRDSMDNRRLRRSTITRVA